MGIASEKHDQIVETIFAQLDRLREMARSAEETDLHDDLEHVLDVALTRYCEQKRDALALALSAPVREPRRLCA